MLGLVIEAGAYRLNSEKDLVMICDRLVAAGNEHPFKHFESEHSPVVSGEWLEFLKAYHLSGGEADESSAWSFAITKWRGKNRWINRPKPVGPQPQMVPPPTGAPKKGLYDEEIRSAIGLQLGQLISQGEDLKRRLMLDHLAYDADYRFGEWEKKCEELLESFDKRTLGLFRTIVPDLYNPLKDRLGTGISYNHAGLFEKIASRVQRLGTIRDAVLAGELDVS